MSSTCARPTSHSGAGKTATSSVPVAPSSLDVLERVVDGTRGLLEVDSTGVAPGTTAEWSGRWLRDVPRIGGVSGVIGRVAMRLLE